MKKSSRLKSKTRSNSSKAQPKKKPKQSKKREESESPEPLSKRQINKLERNHRMLKTKELSERELRKLERNKRIMGYPSMMSTVSSRTGLGVYSSVKKVKPFKKFSRAEEEEKRMSFMKRDQARYALLRLEEKPDRKIFCLSKIHCSYKLIITFKEDSTVNCNCFDWRCRCKGFGISCKHILYVLINILKIDMNTVTNNVVSDENKIVFNEAFTSLYNTWFTSRLKQFKPSKRDISIYDEMCGICFTDFDQSNSIDSELLAILKCPKCAKLVHKDCMKCWLENSENKTCVYCRSEVWKGLI
jgi:hypothetical protein